MIVVSACLAGMACKYNGKNNNTNDYVIELVKQGKAIPVCPEMLGGLPTPRIPSEIHQGRVINQAGQDVTYEFEDGAKKALAITLGTNASCAILKLRSPSCGKDEIYDGSFTSTIVQGDGKFVQLLKENHIPVYSVKEYQELMEEEK